MNMADENINKESMVDAAISKKNEEDKDKPKVSDENKATVGDVIAFKRDGKQLEGIVTAAKLENSVVVDMTIMDNFHEMNMDFEKTVVGHGKYTIKVRSADRNVE